MSADPSRSPRPVGSRELRRGHGVLRDAVCTTKFYIFFEKCKWFFGGLISFRRNGDAAALAARNRVSGAYNYRLWQAVGAPEPGATPSLSSYAVRRSRQAVGACDDKDFIAPAAMLLPLPSHTRQSENVKIGREVRYSRDVGNLPEESESKHWWRGFSTICYEAAV